MTAKKPVDRRQNRSSTKELGLVLAPSSSVQIPSADVRWRAEVVESWNDLWTSPMAAPKVLQASDAFALRRLFTFRHRLLEALDAVDAEPIVLGSMGQPTLSPWAQEVHRLEAALSKLEDKFGLTPMARMRLGVSFEEGVNLAQRNALLLDAFRNAQAGGQS